MDVRPTINVHINIGSNSGHREALIERAVAAVSSAFPGRVERSEIIETEPWGFDSPNPFLNIGLMVRMDACEMDVREVFGKLQEIQTAIDPAPHRGEDGGYIDRAIDIDLIAAGDVVVATPTLTLPHPRMHLREFVLRPMAQLDPGWIHPLTGKSVEEMLEALSDGVQESLQ